MSVAAGAEQEQQEADEGLAKALDSYRRAAGADKAGEEERERIEARVREIEAREIISTNSPHEAREIPYEGRISIGPPTLTRFEKARILGARALQLSLGAPPFIEIPEYARTSLEIAMKELELRVIPIVIRRVLPNGDYQNAGIMEFKDA